MYNINDEYLRWLLVKQLDTTWTYWISWEFKKLLKLFWSKSFYLFKCILNTFYLLSRFFFACSPFSGLQSHPYNRYIVLQILLSDIGRSQIYHCQLLCSSICTDIKSIFLSCSFLSVKPHCLGLSLNINLSLERIMPCAVLLI